MFSWVFLSEFCIQWIYRCVLNPNMLICHLFLARRCRRWDASSFNSITQFNSGESLHSMNLLLCIESDLRFLFCRYLGPYLGFWHLTCTDFGSFIAHVVLFLTTFSREFSSCSVESFCPNTAFNEFIAACWFQISWSVISFLLGAVGDASNFNSLPQFNSGETLAFNELIVAYWIWSSVSFSVDTLTRSCSSWSQFSFDTPI